MELAPDIISAAQSAEAKWKIPASVQLAQYGWESGWGKHEPPASNNPFGMKARPGEPAEFVVTHEFVGGRYETIDAPFRKFASLTQAFDEHAELLATAPCYAKARAELPSLESFCHALTGVYATDPDYGAHLVSLIQTYGLAAYDAPPPPKPAPPIVIAPQGPIAVTPAPAPLQGAKPPLASQTIHGGLSAILGAVVVLVGQLLPLLGFTSAQDAAIVQGIGALGAVYGGVQAIRGRFNATTLLTSKGT